MQDLTFFYAFCPNIVSYVGQRECIIVYGKIAEQNLIQFSETNLFIFDLRIDKLI